LLPITRLNDLLGTYSSTWPARSRVSRSTSGWAAT